MSAAAATYKVTLAYGGPLLRGVSPQPGQRTVASELTTAITRAFSQTPVALAWAARTDAGVHAKENVFSFRLREPVDPRMLGVALAQGLGSDLRVRDVCLAPRSFHARSAAVGKHYRYLVTSGAPLGSRVQRAWHVAVELDVAPMRELALWLPGTRDWSALRHPRCGASNPVKTVQRVSVRARRMGASTVVAVDVLGTGFLRQMVRIMAGTLALVGAGWLTVDGVKEAIVAGRRDATGPSAPAHGLTLMRVEY